MESVPEGSVTTQLVLIVILTLINAFFASAEMAIVSINKNKIRHLAEEGNKKAKLLEDLMNEPSNFLSTIQVGITLAGFFASASAATGVSGQLAKLLDSLSVPYSSNVAQIVVTILLSYVTLVFGELFPKRIALKKAEAIAMFSIKPIIFISKIALPYVKLLSGSTNLLLRITKLNDDDLEEKVSKEEIRSLIEVGQEHGVINETEKDMIESIFEFDDTISKEIMTPRTDVYLLNIDTPIGETIDELLEERFSRIPVYEDDIDNIIGILYMKDFIVQARKVGFDNINIREILHQPYFVPETKNIDILFRELQANKKTMAILIDEYGGFSGILTIEDLIEEVMGNINDEDDHEEPHIEKLDNKTYVANGLLSLDDLADSLHMELEDGYTDTLGGFLINLLGSIPKDGETYNLTYENITFNIEEVKEKRITKVRISL
ncbi:hemolysin family protein [Clostridium intestinale]|uniref:Putative hemolysin n=1 Tax=Clostridium intestinale DSM 6191 TaxID=1121320 RepID=A0A1M6BH59_9CLOT|nr:hemolysin family protein [Clostridium intestinale]SHI48051.1 putative hemolysin [Clostridium intestinale DSM 6191]